MLGYIVKDAAGSYILQATPAHPSQQLLIHQVVGGNFGETIANARDWLATHQSGAQFATIDLSGGAGAMNNLDPFGLSQPVTPQLSSAMAAVPIIGAGVAIRIAASWVTRMIGSAAAAPVLAFFRTVARGAVVKWASLPNWLKFILTGIGIQEGADLIFDDDGPGADGGLVPSPFSNPALPIGNNAIVGTWTANNVKFYRLADGRFAVQNNKGRWKVWRAPRPIVLTSSGASNLRTFIKADRALDRQAKRLKSALGRRTSAPSPKCASCGYVVRNCKCKR